MVGRCRIVTDKPRERAFLQAACLFYVKYKEDYELIFYKVIPVAWRAGSWAFSGRAGFRPGRAGFGFKFGEMVRADFGPAKNVFHNDGHLCCQLPLKESSWLNLQLKND